MIPTEDDDNTLLAGVREPDTTACGVFSQDAVDFLAALSAHIKDSPLWKIPEIAAFGFWCRRTHLETLMQRHTSTFSRLGRGLVFHLAPSNVPTLFAYSYAIGLLAGNANVVRLSLRSSKESLLLCEAIKAVFDRPEFARIKNRSSFISYERNTSITASYFAACDARVIWGGDETVRIMRELPMPIHAVELVFPDRWSCALFSQAAFSKANDEMLCTWAHRFYNDTYLMDQNACSSPKLIIWENDGGDPAVRVRWWAKVAEEAAATYELTAYKTVRKYEKACLAAMELPDGAVFKQYSGNVLYVITLPSLPKQAVEQLNGSFGFFFEAAIKKKEEILPLLSAKVQTLCFEGYQRKDLVQFFVQHTVAGIDRITALGQAMEMDTIWDGKDLITSLSRIIG